ncbi:hypothetical protein N7455_006432 [Penicillium solitum]|uniref:uncharacterized protein n=1 Tax=Penicillium solitum TaxID=60172 RepID=UPI0017B4B5E8|nr:hypothetical protein HAV15_011964 [Penicillium sp. str. \
MPTVSAGLHQFPRRSFVTYKTKATIHELESNLKEAMEGTIDSVAVVSKYSHIFSNIYPQGPASYLGSKTYYYESERKARKKSIQKALLTERQ